MGLYDISRFSRTFTGTKKYVIEDVSSVSQNSATNIQQFVEIFELQITIYIGLIKRLLLENTLKNLDIISRVLVLFITQLRNLSIFVSEELTIFKQPPV